MSSIATSMNTGDLPRQNQSVNVDGTKDTSNNVHDASITMFQPTRNYNDNESNSDTETSNENMLFPSSQTEIGGDRIDDESDNPGRANIRVTAQKTQMVNEDRPESNNVQQNVPKKLSPACPHCRKHKVGCKHRYFINVDESMSTSKNRPRKRKNNSNANNNTSPATSTRMAKNGIPTKKPRQIRFENEETGSIPRKRKLSRVTEEDEEEQEVDSDVYIPSESPPRNQQAKRGRKPNAERLGLNNTTSSSDRKAGKAPVMTESAVELAGPSRLGGFSADNLQGAIHLSRHTTLSRELQQRLEDCEIKWGAAIDSLHSAKSLLDGWVESWQRGL